MLYVPKCDEPDTARCEAVGADKDLQYPVEDMKEFLEKALDAHGSSCIVSRRVSIRQQLRIRCGVRRTPSNLSVYVEPGPPASLENNISANCIERCPRSLGCSSPRILTRSTRRCVRAHWFTFCVSSTNDMHNVPTHPPAQLLTNQERYVLRRSLLYRCEESCPDDDRVDLGDCMTSLFEKAALCSAPVVVTIDDVACSQVGDRRPSSGTCLLNIRY
jgi:hypothetical protein